MRTDEKEDSYTTSHPPAGGKGKAKIMKKTFVIIVVTKCIVYCIVQ